MKNNEIRIRLGDKANKDFVKFWNDLQTNDDAYKDVEISIIPSTPPKSGFGMVVPPEILIAVAKGFAGAVGTGLGKLVWDRLVLFFSTNAKNENIKNPTLIINGEKIPLNPSNMPSEPPSGVLNKEN